MQMEELSALIAEAGTDVYRFCVKLTGNREDADDLYQETFLWAVERHHKIDLAQNPRAFLLSVAMKRFQSQKRRWARRNRIAPHVPLLEAQELFRGEGMEDVLAREDAFGQVRQVVNELSERYRIPVYLYYTLEMDIASIAQVLQVPAGTVKSRLHKARRLIQQKLEAQQDEKTGLI